MWIWKTDQPGMCHKGLIKAWVTGVYWTRASGQGRTHNTVRRDYLVFGCQVVFAATRFVRQGPEQPGKCLEDSNMAEM